MYLDALDLLYGMCDVSNAKDIVEELLQLGRNFMDITPSVRSTSAGRPSISVRTATTNAAPSSRSSLRTPVIIPHIEPPNNILREKRDGWNSPMSKCIFTKLAAHVHNQYQRTQLLQICDIAGSKDITLPSRNQMGNVAYFVMINR